MTDEREDMARQVARGLAYVCRQLDQIRAELQDDLTPLRRLLDAIDAGRDIADALDMLHEALRAGDDALGIYGHTRRGDERPTGVEDSPLEIIYLCPIDRCSGRRWRSVDAVPVYCQISQQELRRDWL